ncbi:MULTISPECIES: tRNA epoxyqueuosine(34) reductase QueG [Priestia]|jgi:epoxyqueuosine reductase|uniref:Epoxyqueuosine reductase n=3 Tax=Priestia megaterium TaxID=1404 RepID=A0AAE5P489_PRIMG|nr:MULTISPECIES: tRNA epoxyqueuosine(34) reductase QueG [Priestia]KOP72823.1 iron-sulfur cluster-binding protein [Bacillus sp. FJAT-21351]KQU19392.1 epoxyqueuosine reductase [Bacillus sp. Leaf75]MCF6800332.1 tRNA epoxyqueuosine(34) reductase QueG [Bacillus sp. ET1]MDP9580357.1 epoxyqueuosine reductase [Bacillus sp. 1751]MEB2277826.1 tRNA epoxyqueuosine(34) reductase QueG [Bacillus sp. ILBB4]RFB18674.1 tRNA epoxyqueuosine(34) reductase QueG [Bacillus sp. ALD]RFB32168.1 tRNA epoxyqueuosine(34)
MNAYQLKEEIISYSKEIGIDKIGFASASMFDELKNRLLAQQELGYASGFEEPDIEKRVDPTLVVPKARSIISIALAYPSKLKDAPKSTKEDRRGIFCRASWGQDYHTVLRDRLQKLETFIKEKVPAAILQSMVDTGELSDRAVAERAGIGWSGKNCAIITPEFGSYVYLGEMITDIPFPPDKPIEDGCGTCNKCVDACPTGALVTGGQLNSQRCIAFLTQTKGFLAEEFRSKLGNRLYGCDTCQTVCPENKGKDFHFHPEMEPDPELAKPKLKPLLTMSNREFKEKFGHVSGSWRGKKPIQRNAIIALAHFKDQTAVPDLIELIKNDVRPVIRGTAAWALGKIGDKEALDTLMNLREKEKDQEVIEEMSKGIEMLQEI